MRLVALIAVLAMASVAGAADQVWFTSSGASVQGAPGVTMVLPLPGAYDIDVYISATDNLYGFDVALTGPAADVASGLTSFALPAAGYGIDAQFAGPGPDFLWLAQSSLGLTWTGGPVKVASFHLVAVEGDIIGGSNPNGGGWGDDVGNAPGAQYGAFFAADGYPGSYADGPAIQVLPEPATLALLGFGLVGLLRRR